MSSEKLYRVKTKEGAHINEKQKKDGSRAAIQFDDENGLQGPVDLIEVDESEYTREVYVEVPVEVERQERSFGQVVLEDAVAPAVADALTIILTRGVEVGIDAFGTWMSQTVIPAAKEKSAELYDKARESRAVRKAKKSDSKLSISGKKPVPQDVKISEGQDQGKGTVVHTSEEITQIVNNMKFAALYIAAGIRELSNTVIADDGMDPEKTLEMQEKLNKLSTGDVMKTIEFMLEDSNRDMLDQATIQLFDAFRHKDFIVNGERVPISKYLSK